MPDVFRTGVLLGVAIAAGACQHALRPADPGRPVVFPRDHASHADAQTEWWHFHGHVRDANGHRYDWFLAFVEQHTDLDHVLGLPVRLFVDPFHVAYFAITDRSAGSFFAREKHNYPDTWAASADTERLAIRHDGWSAVRADDGAMVLNAASLSNALRLKLRPLKAHSLLGDAGYLYVPPRSSSHYYSRPRMAVQGTLTIDGREVEVEGLGWFKHQWGFMYDSNLEGWVWFGVQLSSGQELEIGVIFADGWKLAEGSFAVIQERDGTLTQLDPRTVGVVELGDTWRSPRTDTVYPTRWKLEIPGRGTLTLAAPVSGQEMVIFPANLWAGGLEVTGMFDGERVSGDCFAEVVGLDEPFGRDLLASGKPRDWPDDPPGRRAYSPSPVTTTTTATIAFAGTSSASVSTSDETAPALAFAQRCAACHGPRGRGDGPAAANLVPRPRDFSRRQWQASITDAQIETVIREGGASIGLAAVMPSHPDLDGALLAELRRLVRSFTKGPR